ncbi:MAG: methionine--tRNA ligase [Candidatus Fermentibacter sp.]|nr:methionine--tRNA ligase [Candidatus Fermentibacter sp.]
MDTRYLVTSALPYANGPLHLGHLAGAYLPADIYVRFLRMCGEDVIYVCGTDEHGVPITITAEKQGRTPREVVDEYHATIRREFEAFGISFDNFSRTSLPSHAEFARGVFLDLLGKGLIAERTMKQLHCPRCSRFLPDRYVNGTCPKCGAPGARGDLCESCGSWLEALELKAPSCSICGSEPSPRDTTHWFLRLDAFQDWLREWLPSREGWRDNVLNYCRGWLDEGLQERAITRDIDWGVPVPLDAASGKVLYVWFEALLGYVSSTRELFEKRGDPGAWEKWWKDPGTRLVHFIGKDNIVFHAIIEPAILRGLGGFVLPWNIPANEFLNISGQKQSTSRGTAVWMGEYLERFQPDPMRYTLSINAPEGRDADFTWAEFRVRNNELADVLGNFVNRTVSFAFREFGGLVPACGEPGEREKALADMALQAGASIRGLLSTFRFKAACAEAMALAREGNRYFDSSEPWRTARTSREECARTIRHSLEFIDWLRLVFSPFLPFSCERIAGMLGGGRENRWDAIGRPSLVEGTRLGQPVILFEKLEEGFDGSAAPGKPAASVPPGVKGEDDAKAPAVEPEAPARISFDEFRKLDLRVGRIISAEPVPKADKLLAMKVDLGEPEPRSIVAGLRQWYEPDALAGRLVVVVSNLEPARIRGVQSDGMILASDGGSGVFVLGPDPSARPGDKVR